MKYIFKHPILLIVIVPAFILTLIRFILDGQNGCIADQCGFIVGTNYRDGIWFQAVASTAFKTWPFQMPNFAGAELSGYHYLPNLIVYLLSKIGIPIVLTFYKIIPIIFMTSLTLLSIAVARKFKDDVRFVLLFLFFIFFGMHLSLILSLYHHGFIQNNALINTFQATNILESPHASFALLILLEILILLHKQKQSTRDIVVTSILLFLVFGTKFYVAFSISVILFVFELLTLIKSKDIRTFIRNGFIYGVASGIAILLFYNPFQASANGSIFTFAPFATVHHLIETSDLFYNNNLILARYYLYEHGWSPRLIGIELYSIILFIVYYFGTRIIGFIQILQQIIKRQFHDLELAMTISILVSIVMSVMFIQQGDWFNPIQFAVPAAFLMNIFAAKFLYELVCKHAKIGYSMIAIIVLITLPANLINLSYSSHPARLVLSYSEIDALKFLKEQPDGSVFVPTDGIDMAYVTAFSEKPSYFIYVNGAINAGINIDERAAVSKDRPIELITNQQVDYFYLPQAYEKYTELFEACTISTNYDIIFKNEEVSICSRIK